VVKTWKILFTQQAQKDAKKISVAKLKGKVIKLLDILEEDPFKIPPNYEKLIGDLSGLYSRRINIQHRLVYQVYKKERIVKVIRLWSHYD
jgi:Txe/YoeB family toxin of toxin-antitoxin system